MFIQPLNKALLKKGCVFSKSLLYRSNISSIRYLKHNHLIKSCQYHLRNPTLNKPLNNADLPPRNQSNQTKKKGLIQTREYFGFSFLNKIKNKSDSSVVDESSKAVNIAIAMNVLCSLSKFGAFLYTGSGSLLSEALHSTADLANQIFLYIGIQRSKKEPTEDFPLGFGGERFVWALISAVGLFTFGSAGSIVHGIHSVIDPVPLENLSVAFWVLGASLVLESISIIAAIRAINMGAKDSGMTFLQYVRHGPDPMGVAVLLEDGSAIVGIGIATLFTVLTYMTGLPIYDAIGSIMIGGLLGATAIFLIKKNVASLVGKAMPKSKRDIIRKLLESRPDIDAVHKVKAVMIGADAATVSAEVVFNGSHFVDEYLKIKPIEELAEKCKTEEGVKEVLDDYSQYFVSKIGKQVDTMEELIKSEVPETKFVDIESHYQNM